MAKLKYIFLLIGMAAGIWADAQDHLVFSLGKKDGSGKEFALFPEGYQDFLARDFGYEDKVFWVGTDLPETDLPYVLPGPSDGWGGTGPTAGIRSHFLNLSFLLENADDVTGLLSINLVDADTAHAVLLKITVNGVSRKYPLKKGKGKALAGNTIGSGSGQSIEFFLPKEGLSEGLNTISLTILEGGWIAFDAISVYADRPISLIRADSAVVGTVKPADYQLVDKEQEVQPLLVEVFHLEGQPRLEIRLDGTAIFDQNIEEGKYLFEVPMPAVNKQRLSEFEILIDRQLAKKGEVQRAPQPRQMLANYVNTLLGTAHSRWMIAPGPWMPFGMVKLSPDNQNPGWQAGYDPNFESIGTFSHIHEWTMTGLGTFPTSDRETWTTVGDQSDPSSGYRSRIDKSTEKAGIGLYEVHLTDSDILASLTATNRASFQKYTYRKGDRGRVMIDLTIPSEYRYQVLSCEIRQSSPTRIEGKSHQLTPNAWSDGVEQEYTVHFVIEFDQPIKRFSSWVDGIIADGRPLSAVNPEKAGVFVEFDLASSRTVQMRTGISYVSVENALENLQTEISKPFGWDFKAVVKHQIDEWEALLSRLKVTSNDAREKERFYTNMYRALASRNTYSDVDGSWRDADEKMQQFSDPDDLALGCDAFWNTFWNLNQFWNLVTPEWSNRWVRSQLAMYDNAGWLAKGPAGMEYVPVMVAEHEIPLMVGAYQMGIRDYDVDKAFEAVVKMQTTEATRVGGGLAGNRDLNTYLEHHYVPYDKGRFSNSLEYSFDDWAVSQFAWALGKEKEYRNFSDRGTWWKNVMDPETGFARMRDSEGKWLVDFDPFRSGANHHYVEGNAWQLTFFVPQDVPGLIEAIGHARFIERLEWGFQESNRWRFNGPNDQYWDFPVVQGNQQSMHFAFLFNYAGKPWLTQKWSRAILDRYYGYEVTNAYLGDEDQGQMSAWYIMASLGLFQINGGTGMEPIYELGSPLFEEIEINLGNQFNRGETFTIKANNTSRKNKYIQSATLNGELLNRFWFPVGELLKGGELILEMGDTPNKSWGISELPE